MKLPRIQVRNAGIMQCTDNDPTRTGHGLAKSRARNTKNLINSAQTPRGSADFPPDLRWRRPNPTESQPRAHGAPTHSRPDKTARRPVWRGWGRPNRVPRHSSCESRGARPSRGRRGSWRAPRTATAAVAAAATVRRRRQRGQGRPSRHSPRRRGSGEPNPRLPPPRARLSCFSGVYLVEKGSGSGGN